MVTVPIPFLRVHKLLGAGSEYALIHVFDFT